MWKISRRPNTFANHCICVLTDVHSNNIYFLIVFKGNLLLLLLPLMIRVSFAFLMPVKKTSYDVMWCNQLRARQASTASYSRLFYFICQQEFCKWSHHSVEALDVWNVPAHLFPRQRVMDRMTLQSFCAQSCQMRTHPRNTVTSAAL